jgi:hypothetical protein
MGGLVGGIFDLLSGDPATQQENQLQTLGTTQTSTGENLVTPAATFYEDILSGDQGKIAQALAPEISAGQGQVEQAALQGANFGTRSGGTAAASRAAEDQNRANIINLVGGLQNSAASGAASLGTDQESMGSGNINDVAKLKTQRQQQATSDWSGIGQGVADLVTGLPDIGNSYQNTKW